MITENPVELLSAWLQEERSAGAPNPQQAVLSTAAKESVPHARVVAIREISDDGLLFFTQKGTKKVSELKENPVAAVTFWFELLQREVIIEGGVEFLTDAENDLYWQRYPREAQVRFYAYAPTSSRPILNKQMLEEKKKQVEIDYADRHLPMSPFYCGVRLIPSSLLFYAYRTDELSDVSEYCRVGDGWVKQVLSP